MTINLRCQKCGAKAVVAEVSGRLPDADIDSLAACEECGWNPVTELSDRELGELLDNARDRYEEEVIADLQVSMRYHGC